MSNRTKEEGSPGKVYLLKEITEKRTKQGKPYLALILGTSEEEIEGRIWDMELSSLPDLVPGDPVRAGAPQERSERISGRTARAVK